MILNDRKYTKDHEWVLVEGNIAKIGITDHAQEALGDIVYVEMPQIDDEFAIGDAIASVESVKAASSIFTPVAGKVVEINEELDGAPEKLNEDANANYIVAVEFTEMAGDLMSAQEYEKYLETVEE